MPLVMKVRAGQWVVVGAHRPVLLSLDVGGPIQGGRLSARVSLVMKNLFNSYVSATQS